MKASFVRMDWENRLQTIASFYFAPLGIYRYEAGQYATLSVPHVDFDSRGYTRTMTLSSSPTEPLLRFTMRLLPVGGSSYKRALLSLRPGDTVTVFASMGDLILPLDETVPLVFVAGGIGIASFSGMVRWLADNRQQRDVAVHYAVARPGDIALQAAFNVYAEWQRSVELDLLTRVLYTPSVNSGHGGYDLTAPEVSVKQKRLTAIDIKTRAKPNSLYYVSGTEAMVQQLRQGLMDGGINSGQIIFDYFDGYTDE